MLQQQRVGARLNGAITEQQGLLWFCIYCVYEGVDSMSRAMCRGAQGMYVRRNNGTV